MVNDDSRGGGRKVFLFYGSAVKLWWIFLSCSSFFNSFHFVAGGLFCASFVFIYHKVHRVLICGRDTVFGQVARFQVLVEPLFLFGLQ